MKLKKIASLMLAGVMAVSMLAACAPANETPDDDDNVVTDPIDTSFAAAVNTELSAEQKNVITIGTDSTLNSVLTKVAATLDSEALTPYFVQGFGVVRTVDAMDMRHLLDIDEENGLFNPRKDLFSDKATSATTTADIFVVDGSYTEEGLAEYVADLFGAFINAKKMPATGINGSAQYRYNYTGNIARVKVTNLSGDFESYVVAVTVTQTPTKVTNVDSGK